MLKLLVLLLFARASLSCDCPGITINGTDQPNCWQVVDRNESTWSSADDACAAVGGRMGQPEDNETMKAIEGYLKQVYTLPVLTGYAVGNAQMNQVALVCRSNEFYAVANGTDQLIVGSPADSDGCVFITNTDYKMHYGLCSTASVVLCSQPEKSDDFCSVAPTCSTTTTTNFNSTTSFTTGTTGKIGNDIDNSTTTMLTGTTTAFTGTSSTMTTTTGNGTIPTTTLLPPTTVTPSVGNGVSTTTSSGKTTCKSGGVWFFGWCVPLWLLILTGVLLAALILLTLLACCHYCCGLFFCCKSHSIPKPVVADVEKGPETLKHSKGTQCEPPEEKEKELALPPPVVAPLPIIAPIPIDYSPTKPETEDKGMMTDPWMPPEPVIIYRDREPGPKVDYETEPRALLPPQPVTARSEEPPLMESDEEDGFPRRLVAGPTAVIVRPVRRRERSPDLITPRDPFPALPRRALTDEDLPERKEEPKRQRLPVAPVVFQHNAPPGERPMMQDHEPAPEHTPSRGTRAFPPPPPVSRSPASSSDPRPFPEQFKSASPNPKASRPLPPPPPQEERSFSPPSAPPLKQSRPLQRSPASKPVITQQPLPTNSPRPAVAAPIRPPPARPTAVAAAVPPSARPPPPARSSSGGARPLPAPPARARSSSPARKAPPAPRATSPFAPKNTVAPAPAGGSLFKGAPSNSDAANLRAARGRLGGAAGGTGDAPSGWKAWSANSRAFSTTPNSDFA